MTVDSEIRLFSVCDGSDSGNQTVECVMVVTVEIRLLSV